MKLHKYALCLHIAVKNNLPFKTRKVCEPKSQLCNGYEIKTSDYVDYDLLFSLLSNNEER